MKKHLRKTILLSLVRILILFVLTYTQSAGRSESQRQQKYQRTIAILESLIKSEMGDKDIPGMAIALVEDQKIIWQQGFGFSNPQTKTPITNETVFRVGSVSKLFTDIALMRLVEQGKLNLDAPINNYLPDFKRKNSFNKLPRSKLTGY